MTDIINISYTVNPKVAQGRERFRNTARARSGGVTTPMSRNSTSPWPMNELEFDTRSSPTPTSARSL